MVMVLGNIKDIIFYSAICVNSREKWCAAKWWKQAVKSGAVHQ